MQPHQIHRPDRYLKLIPLVEDHRVLEEANLRLEGNMVELILDTGLVGPIVGHV